MTLKINSSRLRRIIKEELAEAAKGQLQQESAGHVEKSDVVSGASKLLAAIDAFREKATPAAMNAVTPHLDTLEKVLDNMVDTPGSYVIQQRAQPKKVSLKPVKTEGKKS